MRSAPLVFPLPHQRQRDSTLVCTGVEGEREEAVGLTGGTRTCGQPWGSRGAALAIQGLLPSCSAIVSFPRAATSEEVP